MFNTSIVLVLISQFFSATMYGLASPFLPTVFEEKDIPSVWTGVIFSIYAVAMMIISLFVGKILDKVSHKSIITSGCFLMGVSVAGFGFIERFDTTYCIALSIILRIGQGKFTFHLSPFLEYRIRRRHDRYGQLLLRGASLPWKGGSIHRTFGNNVWPWKYDGTSHWLSSLWIIGL